MQFYRIRIVELPAHWLWYFFSTHNYMDLSLRTLITTSMLLYCVVSAQAFGNSVVSNQQKHVLKTSKSDLAQPQGTIIALSLTWPTSDYHNPFSTRKIAYEIWHDGFYMTTVRNNKIVFELNKHPQLTGGCFQIRQIDERGTSPFSDQTCYSVPNGVAN